MEITPSLIYWIGIMDNIKDTLLGPSVILALISIFALIVVLVNWNARGLLTIHKVATFTACGLSITCFIVAGFLPSSKTLAAMYIVPKIANNTQVQQLPDKLLILSNEWLEELRPKKN